MTGVTWAFCVGPGIPDPFLDGVDCAGHWPASLPPLPRPRTRLGTSLATAGEGVVGAVAHEGQPLLTECICSVPGPVLCGCTNFITANPHVSPVTQALPSPRGVEATC